LHTSEEWRKDIQQLTLCISRDLGWILGGGRTDENVTIKWGGCLLQRREEGYTTINLGVVHINY
jgi:hypothetical protein